MRARDLGEALKMIMEDRAWSQTQLGQELGHSQTWVSRVIRGDIDPGTRAANAYLDRVGWELHITPISDGEGTEDDPVKRRAFLSGLASIGFVPPPKTTPFHDPEYVKQLTYRASRIHNEIGGASIRATLLKHAQGINAAAIDGGRDLHFAVSEYMRCGSYILREAGHRDAGIKFANNALLHAQQSGNPDQQAAAYFALGLVGDFSGDVGTRSANSSGRAVMFAQRGLQIPDVSDETRAYLNGLLACGFASAPGHERQARMAIERALSIDTLPIIARADIIGDSGNALRDIGAHSEALKLLDDAVRLSSQHTQLRPALYLNDQIMIALSIREPLLAASLMNTLSYVIPFVDSARVDKMVVRVLQASKPWDTVPAMREARERLLSVLTASEG